MNENIKRSLAIIGGGPAALMVYKRLIDAKASHFLVHIFESTETLGCGMPYSEKGANIEHVTNVSANELPELAEELDVWVKSLPDSTLKDYGVDRESFHEKKVLPRLLFGKYLTAQFECFLEAGARNGVETSLHYNTRVKDIVNVDGETQISLQTDSDLRMQFDFIIICTGHHWPVENEGRAPGCFDSPYPPSKLAKCFNHPVAIRGSSLTAVDAIRTIARNNGHFASENSKLHFRANDDSQQFRVVMYSRHGLLPCVRVHMEEPHAAADPLIRQKDIQKNIDANNGFLELDFLFETGFKLPLKDSDPSFYEQIKDMSMEAFVEAMMAYREGKDPFKLLKAEYKEAHESITNEHPIYWKEMLSALSFAMNYPAKYLSAEDMLRLQNHLMPLISVVIAFVPQSSCEELLAMHEAGYLELVADGGTGSVEFGDDGDIIYNFKDESGKDKTTHFKTLINCIGQKHFLIDDFPFKSLLENGTVSGARVKFKSPDAAKQLIKAGEKNVEQAGKEYYLKVSGVAVTDQFQLVARDGTASEQIYLMSVPYMGGFNPDYSGLDFCEHASELLVGNILMIRKGHRRNRK